MGATGIYRGFCFLYRPVLPPSDEGGGCEADGGREKLNHAVILSGARNLRLPCVKGAVTK